MVQSHTYHHLHPRMQRQPATNRISIPTQPLKIPENSACLKNLFCEQGFYCGIDNADVPEI